MKFKPKPVKLSKEEIKKLAEEGLKLRREVERRADKMFRRSGVLK